MNSFSKKTSKLVALVFMLTIVMSMFTGMSFAAPDSSTTEVEVTFDISGLNPVGGSGSVDSATLTKDFITSGMPVLWLDIVPSASELEAAGVNENAFSSITWSRNGSDIDPTDQISWSDLNDTGNVLTASGTLASYPVSFYYGDTYAKVGQTPGNVIFEGATLETIGNNLDIASYFGSNSVPSVTDTAKYELVWTTDQEGELSAYGLFDYQMNPADVSGTGADRHIKLYAQLRELPLYTVKYDLNGGTSKYDLPDDSNTENKLTNTPPGSLLSKEGFTFKGWKPSTTAMVQGGDNYWIDASDSDANNVITLVAQWESDGTYNIYYDLNLAGLHFVYREVKTDGAGMSKIINFTAIPGFVYAHTEEDFLYWSDDEGNKYYGGETITVTKDTAIKANYIEYFTTGANGTYYKGDGGSYKVVADLPFDQFSGVGMFDSKLQPIFVDHDIDYTVSESSIAVTFTPEFLSNLPAGEYRILIALLNDETVGTTLTIAEGNAPIIAPPAVPQETVQEGGSPRTSDNSFILFAIAGMFIASLGLAFVAKKAKKASK